MLQLAIITFGRYPLLTFQQKFKQRRHLLRNLQFLPINRDYLLLPKSLRPRIKVINRQECPRIHLRPLIERFISVLIFKLILFTSSKLSLSFHQFTTCCYSNLLYFESISKLFFEGFVNVIF